MLLKLPINKIRQNSTQLSSTGIWLEARREISHISTYNQDVAECTENNESMINKTITKNVYMKDNTFRWKQLTCAQLLIRGLPLVCRHTPTSSFSECTSGGLVKYYVPFIYKITMMTTAVRPQLFLGQFAIWDIQLRRMWSCFCNWCVLPGNSS